MEQPKEDQVVITIKYPTAKEREGISNIEFIKSDGKDQRFSIRYDSDYLVKSFVTEITNLYDERDGKEIAIKTGADLLRSTNKSVQELIQKIIAKLTTSDDITEQEEKN